MAQDTNVENLIINKLTRAQYESITNPDPTQLYFITDEVISSADVIAALGYTPYNATNPAGYISGITSSDVTTALGYTPENVSNKVTSISSSSTNTQYPSAKLVYDQLAGKQPTLVSGTNIKTVNNNSLLGNGNINIDSLPSQTGQSGKFLTTNGTTASWATITAPAWGNITGTLADQTDLQNALNGKQDTLNTTQLVALNSGITSSDVALIGTALQPGDVEAYTAAEVQTLWGSI